MRANVNICKLDMFSVCVRAHVQVCVSACIYWIYTVMNVTCVCLCVELRATVRAWLRACVYVCV